MKELEELLEDFRSWNKVWEQFQNKKNIFNTTNVKPTTKDVFLSALNEKYKVVKKEKNE